jgi:hypothetical protein
MILQDWEVDLVFCIFSEGVAGPYTEVFCPPKAEKGVEIPYSRFKVLSDNQPQNKKEGFSLRIQNPIRHKKRVRIIRMPIDDKMLKKPEPPPKEVKKIYKSEEWEQCVTANQKSGTGSPANEVRGTLSGSGAPLLEDLQPDDGLAAIQNWKERYCGTQIMLETGSRREPVVSSHRKVGY